jgi:hypothetical protein
MALTQVDQGLLGTYAQYTGFKNRIINGAMVIDQRNAGASVTPNGTYTLDRWAAENAVTSKFTVQQNAGSVTPPVGFTKYLGVTSSSSYSSGASEYFDICQRIEGYNIADLAWGTANAKPITLSFWAYSSLTGTFSGALQNSNASRSYPFTYTVSSANTWTQASITVAGDTSGTWLTTNGVGVQVCFDLGSGTTLRGTAGSWSGNWYIGATGAVSVIATNGATFYLTGVQLEKGSTATSFDYRPYGTELALCQRYYYRAVATGPYGYISQFGIANATTSAQIPVKFPVTMRTAPSSIDSSNVQITDSVTNFSSPSSIPLDSNQTSADVGSFSFNQSGLTQYRMYIARGNNSTSTYIGFSAEL